MTRPEIGSPVLYSRTNTPASKAGVVITSSQKRMTSAIARFHRLAGRFRKKKRRCCCRRLRKLRSPNTGNHQKTVLPSMSYSARRYPLRERSGTPTTGLEPCWWPVIRLKEATTTSPGESERSRHHRCGRRGRRALREGHQGSRCSAHAGGKM